MINDPAGQIRNKQHDNEGDQFSSHRWFLPCVVLGLQAWSGFCDRAVAGNARAAILLLSYHSVQSLFAPFTGRSCGGRPIVEKESWSGFVAAGLAAAMIAVDARRPGSAG